MILSTLAAIASGLAAGARRGLLVKGGGALEVIGRVRIAAFDKTGTLTQGKPRVTDVLALSGTERSVLGLAAPRKHRPDDEGVTPASLSGAYLGRQRLDFLLTIMKAWQFSLDISANIGICGVGGRFEVPEEVAIVSDLVLNKRLVEALCRNRCVALLNSQMRRREGFREPHAQAIGNSSQFSLRLLMLVDEVRPKLTDLGRLPPPLAKPSHVLLLDLDLNVPGEERAISLA